MTLDEYAQHVGTRSKVVWIDNVPWCAQGGILRPLAMPHRMPAVSAAKVRRAMSRLGALLAQWTEGWDTPPCPWWYVVCDRKDYDQSLLNKGPRRDVRRGLEDCEVRQLDPVWFANNGYAVYAAAYRGYGVAAPLTAEGFVREYLYQARYSGRETWGAFLNGSLVAWESCIIVDDAVMSSAAKSDPQFHRFRPNNAVVYTLTHHYLREQGYAYVTAGTRVLEHDTNTQEFSEKMGYRRVYCPLRVILSPLARGATALQIPAWGRYIGVDRLAPRVLSRLSALAATARIADACRHACRATAERAVEPGDRPE